MLSLLQVGARTISNVVTNVASGTTVEQQHQDFQEVNETPNAASDAGHDEGDGFLNVSVNDATGRQTTEDGEYALVDTDKDDDFIITESIRAHSPETEPGVPSVATATAVIEAMTRQELVSYCAKILLPRKEMAADDARAAYEDLTTGLQALSNCADEWLVPGRPLCHIRNRIIRSLYVVPAHTQWWTVRVMEKLFACVGMGKLDVETAGYLELAAMLWVVKTGVRELALALIEPRRALEAVDTIKQELSGQLEGRKEKDVKMLLQIAQELHFWADYVKDKYQWLGAAGA